MSTPSPFPPQPGQPSGVPPRRRSSPWLGLFIGGALALMTLFAGVAVIAILFLNGLFARHPPPVGDTPPVAQAPTTTPAEPAPPVPLPTDPATPPERPETAAPAPTPVVEHEPLRRASSPSGRDRRAPEREPARSGPSPVRAGGEVSQPRKIHNVQPQYPEIAVRSRVQGAVILEATIDVDGKVESVRVLRSIPLLDQAAIDAVRQWQYEPALRHGVPVPVLMTVTVTFALQAP